MRRTSRTPWYAAATLIGLAGLLTAAAAAVRWYPCLGNLAGQTCTGRQRRVYDYQLPIEPWQALPATALLAGLGMFLLAASWPFIVRQLAVRPALRIVMAAILMLKPLLLGAMVLAAPVVGVLPREASPGLLVLEIILDIAALVLLLLVPNDRLPDFQRLLLATVTFWLVGWVGQILDALLFGLLTLDAEVAPGSGLLTAAIMIGCGIGIALITAHTPERALPARTARDPLERTGRR